MDSRKLLELLEHVRRGELAVESAAQELETLPFKDLGFARVDRHREIRQGMPEVILAQGKTTDQIAGVAEDLLSQGSNVLITRLDEEPARALLARVPSLEYVPLARIAKFRNRIAKPLAGTVAVVTAGTSDLPVAEEAIETLAACGVTTDRIVDVGVAGIHRLLPEVERLRRARALIVVAGMEGALASVIGGLVASPVIAVPTSVGYGVSLGGLTPLFAMLSSCASGVVVVNIDNGFGAAMAALRLLHSEPRQ